MRVLRWVVPPWRLPVTSRAWVGGRNRVGKPRGRSSGSSSVGQWGARVSVGSGGKRDERERDRLREGERLSLRGERERENVRERGG